jgi:hypothetical protein
VFPLLHSVATCFGRVVVKLSSTLAFDPFA